MFTLDVGCGAGAQKRIISLEKVYVMALTDQLLLLIAVNGNSTGDPFPAG